MVFEERFQTPAENAFFALSPPKDQKIRPVLYLLLRNFRQQVASLATNGRNHTLLNAVFN